jgi:hypothetical protein
MKILYLFPLFLFLQTATAQTPLYLNFVSHNETSDPLDYDHPTNPAFYNQIKALAQRVCDTIVAKEAKLNMQVDANFIKGCLLHAAAAASPNDFLEWANNLPFIDVDGHNHFNPIQNPYNYADLAYLLDSCGVVLNKKILGGGDVEKSRRKLDTVPEPLHWLHLYQLFMAGGHPVGSRYPRSCGRLRGVRHLETGWSLGSDFRAAQPF